MPRRAYSYLRVSSPKQAKEHRDGLRRQEEITAAIVEKHRLCLDDTLCFVDRGRSAAHGEHRRIGALGQFLEHIESGRITKGSVLIIENLDRLSREGIDTAYENFRAILRAGVDIITGSPEEVYTAESLDDLATILVVKVHMHRAHEESVLKSERIGAYQANRRQRARDSKKAHSRRGPAWTQLGQDGQFHLLPGAAATVKLIHQLAQEAMGIHRIAAYLIERRKEHPPFAKAGWSIAYVRKILRGRQALGEYQPRVRQPSGRMTPDGEPIAGYYPAVLTENEWRLTQAALDGRRRKCGRPGAAESNLFTGILFESRSRQSLHMDGSRFFNGRPYRYLYNYGHAGVRRHEYGCPYAQVECGLLRTIATLTPSDVLPVDATQHVREARIGKLTDLVTKGKLKVAQIERKIRDPENDTPFDDLDKDRSAIRAKVAAAEKELEALKLESMTGRAENLAEVQSLIELLDESQATPASAEIRRRLKGALRWLVDEIWLLIQPVGGRKSIVHAQIYLRAGNRRSAMCDPLAGPPVGTIPWDTAACDFRAGFLPVDIANAASESVTAKLVNSRLCICPWIRRRVKLARTPATDRPIQRHARPRTCHPHKTRSRSNHRWRQRRRPGADRRAVALPRRAAVRRRRPGRRAAAAAASRSPGAFVPR